MVQGCGGEGDDGGGEVWVAAGGAAGAAGGEGAAECERDGDLSRRRGVLVIFVSSGGFVESFSSILLFGGAFYYSCVFSVCLSVF